MRAIGYITSLVVAVCLIACDAEHITQPQTSLRPRLDSMQIVGPDTIMISETMVFYAMAFGTLPSDYLYEWTVIDSPSTYVLSTLRDTCEYVAADVGTKVVELRVRDLSTDNIVSTARKNVQVIRYTT